jgi:hypothetical protein
MEFEGLPWDFERKWNLGRPKTGSALHHLVTAFSVKKGLMILRGIEAVTPLARVMRRSHSRQKRRKGGAPSVACTGARPDSDR